MNQNQTVLHVFYNDLVSTRYRKNMFQTWMNVLAMFGGLTGLFVGFSLVTGYEIISDCTSTATMKKDIYNPQKLFMLFWKSTFVTWIKSRLVIFCTNTASHGFPYFIRTGYSKIEKTFWVVVVVICSMFAVLLVWYSLFLSSATPTVTLVESTHYPTYKIPFPGVTVCNVNKISKKAIVAFAKKLKNPIPNATEDDTLELLKQLNGYIQLKTDYGDRFDDLNKLLAFNKLKIENVMATLMPECDKTIEKCFWLGTEVRCDAFFESTVTFLGNCCSFNYVGLKSYRNSSRRAKSSILQEAKLVTASGPLNGLTIVLNPLVDDYFFSTFKMKGFRVIVHDSYDFPELNSPNVFVQHDYVARVGINPESTYSKDEIYSKDIMLRLCYSDSEIRLNVMQRYSYINCMVECRRLIAFKLCGCVPYNYPRNGSLPICDAVQQRCIIRNFETINDVNPLINESLNFMPELPFSSSSCHCLPPCKYYQYQAVSFHGRIKYNQSVRTQKYLRGIETQNKSIVHVYYTDIVTTVYRRDMYLNWMSVVAMFGGLTGLFMGLSLLNVFEFNVKR
ncbi:pickpocket protein 11-like [Culicoides brevitarsis]|uniref:pickpocket protein 11-like n=1 Tax=Culicoides brevitarsis TaxID=469753 RepID=UPI00307BECB9